MRRMFWDDPYLHRSSAKVVSIEGNRVKVDPTIFFAESGGQESDYGTIAGINVKEAIIEGDDIYYELTEEPSFSVGDDVELEIDWPRRYALMRLHFAAEVVLEIVYKLVPGIEKIGAHIAQNKSRIDFVYDKNISHLFPEIIATANDLIAQDLEIKSQFKDENALRRCWIIEGFAEVPCGGTHLKTTSEIGTLRLKRKNIGGGKERIEIYVE